MMEAPVNRQLSLAHLAPENGIGGGHRVRWCHANRGSLCPIQRQEITVAGDGTGHGQAALGTPLQCGWRRWSHPEVASATGVKGGGARQGG